MMTAPARMRRPPATVSGQETTTVVNLVRWTYQDQRADSVSGVGVHASEAAADGDTSGCGQYGADSITTAERNGVLGASIRSTGHLQRYALHPDAEAVHAAVVSLPWGHALMLMQTGRTGQQPTPELHQTLDPVLLGGRPRVDVVETVTVRYPSGEYRKVAVTACPLEMYPPDCIADQHRAQYQAWADAITALGRILAGVPLVRWTIGWLGL